MLDKNQWLAIGLLSGFAYILGKDRESFEAQTWKIKCDVCGEKPIYDTVDSEDYGKEIQVCEECFNNIFTAESFEATKGQKDYNYSYGDWDDSIYGVQIYDTDMKLKDVKKMLKDAGIKTKKPVASLARDYGFYFIIDKSQAESFEKAFKKYGMVGSYEYEAESFGAETGDGVITCKKCVKVDPVFQSCLNDLENAWDNIGYDFSSRIYCPSCGKPLEVRDSFGAESFEAENLYNSQKENMTLVALGRAHKQILDGPSRATMEIRVEDKPVIFAIYEAANYFAPLTNPIELQSRYDSHNFVEPDWRDEYYQALSALKEAFPSWSMFSPKLEKSFDL